MSHNNILEEGQEITIERDDDEAASTSSHLSLVNEKSVSDKMSSELDSVDISNELEELNSLFQELEAMITEKKETGKIVGDITKPTEEEKESMVAQTREKIFQNDDQSSVSENFIEEDENFPQELEEFCQNPSSVRLINQLTTCQPPENNKKYTTISEYGNYYKARMAINLKSIIEESGVSHAPIMYIASGLDIEFPLLLQARHIIMVDPCFSREDAVNQIIAKVNQYDSYEPRITQISPSHHNIKFRFNFGRDLEIVNLDLFGKRYEEYLNFLPLGAIIEYNSSLDHTLAKPDLLRKLMNGGLIINNQPSPIRDLHLGWLNRLSNTLDPDKIEDQNAQYLGLKSRRLPFLPFAIYQKENSTANLLKYSEELAEKSI